ncbi:MAG: flagellar motor protein [bacterium]|nr:flagellar motor protein [bacterium]
MDFATILGLATALATIGGAYALEGGTLDSVFLMAPMLIVIGGTMGATMITTSFRTVLHVPKFLRLVFFGKSYSHQETINQLVSLSERARREGILGLEAMLSKLPDSFFKKAIQLVIDGTEATALRGILETEIIYVEERHKRGIIFFQKAGGFSPTMGILGTVLGLINTLSNTSDASRMAGAIAAAFIATLWGVGLANLFFLPVSDKLKMRHEEELGHLELITEGVIAIQAGENPRNVRTRLLSFLAPQQRKGEY